MKVLRRGTYRLLSLLSLMFSFPYSDRKQLFIKKRREFQRNPQSQPDLDAYDRHDNTHDYTVIKGLIPPGLVGKEAPGGKALWEKSDTFFSDYKTNHPEQILSESDESFVITNIASHDTRQYLAKWDPDSEDRTKKAGMSFMHLLVIPKRRFYNAVALHDASIIDEMMTHFRHFWSNPDSADKIIGTIEQAVERRAKATRDALLSHKPDLVDEFDAKMQEVQASTQELAKKLRESQKSQDDKVLFFGFHPAPDVTVAHLHMHVILVSIEFRKFSTRSNDWKTIPAQAIIDVIQDESDNKSTKA